MKGTHVWLTTLFFLLFSTQLSADTGIAGADLSGLVHPELGEEYSDHFDWEDLNIGAESESDSSYSNDGADILDDSLGDISIEALEEELEHMLLVECSDAGEEFFVSAECNGLAAAPITWVVEVKIHQFIWVINPLGTTAPTLFNYGVTTRKRNIRAVSGQLALTVYAQRLEQHLNKEHSEPFINDAKYLAMKSFIVEPVGVKEKDAD